jgi:Bacterial PH domain
VDKPQTFRSPTAVVVWVVWLLFAVGNWIDLAVQGRDHESAVAAAILLLVTGTAYVTAQRPRIIADDAGVTVRNPLRDHRIGWAAVARVDLADVVRLHCEWGQRRKVISAWAVHYSRRRQLAAEARARRPARSAGGRLSPLGFGAPVSGPAAEASPAEAEAEKVVQALRERATAARAEAVWAAGPAEVAGANVAGANVSRANVTRASVTGTKVDEVDGTEPLESTWSGRAIAALVIPALILLVVCLL